jgi:hypothetical protein
MKKKLGASLFAAAAVGAMLVAPAGAVPGPNTNSTSYWEATLSAAPYNYENVDCTKSYSGAGKMSWTVGAHDLVMVKGGSVLYPLGPGIKGYWDFGGGSVIAPDNNGGNQAAISWIMWCDWDDDETYS